MSATRDLFVQHPYLVGSVNARAWSETYAYHFDREIEGVDLFAAQPGQSVADRIALSNSHDVPKGMEDKNNFIQDLKELVATTEAIRQGQSDLVGEQELLVKLLSQFEHLYPDVSAIMTVNQAATAQDGGWG